MGYNTVQIHTEAEMKHLKYIPVFLLMLMISVCGLVSVPVMLSASNGQQPEVKLVANTSLFDSRPDYAVVGFNVLDTRCGPYPSFCGSQVFYSLQFGWNKHYGPYTFFKYEGYHAFLAPSVMLQERDASFPVHQR